MALSFNELLGQPFAPSVKRELEKRRSLNQRYETSPTLHNPYFKLRRIEKMTNNEELNRESRKSRDNIKFWELTKLSKQGLNDIKEKVDNGGNVKAPVGITDVSIEVKDYTFHTLEVNFVIPDVADWEAFKETWLVFGAPVEYEFGRESLVEIENNEDITPDKEIREGLIANFSWSLGEQNRTITGSLTIYSSTYVELTKMAHSAKYDGVNISSTIRQELKKIQMQYSTIENIKDFHGESWNVNKGTINFSNLDSNNDVDKKFLNKSKYFYAIMDKDDYSERLSTITSRRKESNRLFGGNDVGLGYDPNTQNERPLGIDDIIPFGVEIMNLDADELMFEFEERERERPNPDDYGLTDQDRINYIESSVPFIMEGGESATDFEEWFRQESRNGRVPDNVFASDELSELSRTITSPPFNNFGQAYVDWSNSSHQIYQSLNDEANNISNTDIQKYALSQLQLSNSMQSEFDSDVYFYVSMRFISDIINWILRYNNDILEEELISAINLLDVRIRDLSLLGLGSSEPDKVIINPWNKRYSKNENYEPLESSNNPVIDNRNNDKVNKYYKLDNKGEYTLLEDVFLSAPLVLDLAQTTDSPLGFVERIIEEIESATKGLLKLQKSEKHLVHKNKFNGKSITYFDPSVIKDKGNDEKTYHKFNLFDYREKIRNIDVNSDLSDDFSQYAYFRSLSKIDTDSSVFYYNDQYYNNDGSKAKNELGTLNTYVISNEERKRIKNKFGIGGTNTSLTEQGVLWGGADVPYRRDKSTNNGFDDMVNQYIINGLELIESYESLFKDTLNSNKQRIERFMQSRDMEDFEVDSTIALLTYIEAYFTVITDIYQLVYNPFEKEDGTTTIPLKVDISLDGIAGIVTGQVFKIDLSSFPMAYNISNTTPLFVVSTLNHSITENNDWETTIGGFLYIPASAKQDAIYSSSGLKQLIDSKNARLEIIGDIFENKINNILNKNNE